MRISLNWLKEFIKIHRTVDKLADDFNLLGHEVEAVTEEKGDFLFDLEITPNRGDCLSILGIARELAALHLLRLKNDKVKPNFQEEDLGKEIEVSVSDPNLCHRFSARVIDKIKIKDSPFWLQSRLLASGLRPINDIVDITNYVMIERGQPLHAFDYNKIKTIAKRKIMNIRLANDNERLVTLDQKLRFLKKGMIVIDDKEKVFDLSGVMGGANSEIDQDTQTIILQAAIFDPVSIRKTAKDLNLSTEASYRYERGVDFNGTVDALNTATNLILQMNPNAKVGNLIDIIFKKPSVSKIKIKPTQINRLLGINLNKQEMIKILERLNFTIKDAENCLLVVPPSYRALDVKIWQDVAEEIARIFGYHKIPKILPKPNSVQFINNRYQLCEFLRDFISSLGYTEVYSYSFIEKEILQITNMLSSNLVETENPVAPETKYLRPDLFPSLLKLTARNPWAPEIKIFEIGTCFNKKEEFKQLGIIQTGKNPEDLKAVFNLLAEKLKIKSLRYEILKPEKSLLHRMKIRKEIIFARLDLEDIFLKLKNFQYQPKIHKKRISLRTISKLSPTIKDLSFIISREIETDKLANEIQSLDRRILLVEPFDEFISEQLGSKNKSVAFHIWMEKPQGSIEESEAKDILKKIVSNLSKKYSAILRGSL